METRNETNREPKGYTGNAPTASNPTAAKKPAAPKQASGQASAPSNQQAGSQGSTASNQGATGQNKGDGQDLLQQAKQATGEIVNQVQQQAGDQLNRQKETAASDLTTVVNAVRRFGENLSNEANGPIARYAAEYGDKAASSLERLSTYIREQDPKQLLGDVQNFGRRRPAVLLGGAFLLGFAGARLIRTSMEAASEHQQQSFRPNAANPNLHAPSAPAPRPSTPNAL